MELSLRNGDYITKKCDHKKIEMSWQIDGLYVKKILSAKEGYGDPPIRSDFKTPSESKVIKHLMDSWGFTDEEIQKIQTVGVDEEVPF